jgi:hypothetical protein
MTARSDNNNKTNYSKCIITGEMSASTLVRCTASSSVGVWQNDGVKIISNDQSDRTPLFRSPITDDFIGDGCRQVSTINKDTLRKPADGPKIEELILKIA